MESEKTLMNVHGYSVPTTIQLDPDHQKGRLNGINHPLLALSSKFSLGPELFVDGQEFELHLVSRPYQ